MKPLAEANIWYGLFVTGSALVLMAHIMEPGDLTFYLALVWICATSLPSAWIMVNPGSRAKALAGKAATPSFEAAPLHVAPTAEEVKIFRNAGIELNDLLCMVRADLSPHGGYANSLVGLTPSKLFMLAGDQTVLSVSVEGLKKIREVA